MWMGHFVGAVSGAAARAATLARIKTKAETNEAIFMVIPFL
jgi:hypothetical protein